jgi:hypothetical protein
VVAGGGDDEQDERRVERAEDADDGSPAVAEEVAVTISAYPMCMLGIIGIVSLFVPLSVWRYRRTS